jgi:DNA polymerase III alpha subunit (gram-positive type)
MSMRFFPVVGSMAFGVWVGLAGHSIVAGPTPFASIAPFLVQPLNAAGVQAVKGPEAAPLDWVMAHLDVETTGLVAGFNEIVDLGIVYTTVDGEILERWHRRLMPRHPERTHPEAAKINGFEPTVWKKLDAIEPKAAVDALLAFERSHFGGKRLVRVAYNSKFDAAFMDDLFKQADAAFDQPNYSYYWLDVPSMAWLLGYRPLEHGDLAVELGVQGTSDIPLEHTGLGCAEYNVRVYRELLARLKKR